MNLVSLLNTIQSRMPLRMAFRSWPLTRKLNARHTERERWFSWQFWWSFMYGTCASQSDFPRLAGGTIPFIRKYSTICP
jgi:hypothetical protein